MTLTPKALQRLYEIRRTVRLRDARPNDGRCGNVSAAVADEFGWRRECGFLQLIDGSVCWVHCWNRTDSGDVVDVTADQFRGLWLGDIIFVRRDDPLANRYLADPQEWIIEPVGSSAAPEGLICRRDGHGEMEIAAGSQPVWRSLAQGVLQLHTGWSLGDPLVDLAARALRAKISSGEQVSTSSLTRPLVTWSIQHLARQGSDAWVAAEFRDPV